MPELIHIYMPQIYRWAIPPFIPAGPNDSAYVTLFPYMCQHDVCQGVVVYMPDIRYRGLSKWPPSFYYVDIN